MIFYVAAVRKVSQFLRVTSLPITFTLPAILLEETDGKEDELNRGSSFQVITLITSLDRHTSEMSFSS